MNLRPRRNRVLLISAAAATAAALVVPVQPATAHPDAASRTAVGGPWTDASYTPTPGDWRPYVLAPHTHTVRPESVLSADPRGGSIDGDPNGLVDGSSSTRLVSTGDRSSSPLVTLDFGKEVGGEVRLHVVSASSPAPELHVCFSESKKEMALAPGQNNGETAHAPGCDTANIWTGYPGFPYTYDADSHTLSFDPAKLPATVQDSQLRGGFRYATIFLDGPGSVTLDDVSLDYQAAPLQSDPADYRGWFLSSDNELNKLWYAGAYTVQTNTWMSDTAKSWPYQNGEADHADAQVPHADPNQEVIFDGAKRDRIVWQGDLAVQAPVTYLSTDDIGAVDNSLTSLAAQQLPDGYVPAESLVGQHNRDEMRTYGEYVTWFVNNEYEHWLYTGDRGYLADNWAALQKATAWLESVRKQDDQGLIAFGGVGSCGHYGYSDCGHETYVNALYVRNLHQMAELAGVLGDNSDQATYANRAKAVAQAINDQLWDASVGAYRLSREIPDAYPQDANATAVLTGVASSQQATRALAYLRKNNWSTYGSLTVSPATPNPSIGPSYEPLPSGFEAEARLAASAADGIGALQAEKLLKTYWGYQLRQDPGSTYWEKLNRNGDPTIGQFTSLSHGWAAAPTIALTTQMLGVTPTSGGFASFDIVPHPGDLTWAQGAVPTPHGTIQASWRSQRNGFALRADVPEGTTARLAAPTGGSRTLVFLDGKLVWNGQRAMHGADASSDGRYVYVSGVEAGTHELRSVHAGAVRSAVQVVAAPAATSTSAGGTVPVHVEVSGIAPRPGARLTVTTPDGWSADPATQTLPLGQDGRPSTAEVDIAVHVPDGVQPGRYQVGVTATAGSETASDTVAVTVEPPGYSFDDGTMGWQAGQNASGVADVTSFANRPGSCASGACLQVTSQAVPATTVRSAYVTPQTPIDMSGASAFRLDFDSYGGVPGASGYQAIVTLTGTDGSTLTKTFPVPSDTWSPLSLDLAGWSGSSSVTRIEVGFSAVGTDYSPWTGAFELDDVTWS